MATVLVAALVCVVGFFLTDVGQLEHPWLIAVLAALIAVEGATAVKLARGGGQSETQGHEEATLVFMALTFSPVAAAGDESRLQLRILPRRDQQYGVHDDDQHLVKPVTPEGLAAAVREPGRVEPAREAQLR